MNRSLDFGYLRRPKWMAGHVIVVLAVVIFISMGFWQLRRLDERREFNSLLTSRTTEVAVPLVEALERYGPSQESLELRAVSAVGTYAPHEEIILIARSYNGLSGHHVVTPLYLGGDRTILVDRGWVPIDFDQPNAPEFEPPRGIVTVTGVLRKTEVRGSFGPSIPQTGVVSQVPRVDLGRLDEQVIGDLEPVYIQLLEQSPAQSSDLPYLVSLPEPSEGPHRGYAVQWFLFALVAAVGYPILLWRTAATPEIPSKPSSAP